MNKNCLFCNTDVEKRNDIVCLKCHEQEIQTIQSDNNILGNSVEHLKEKIRKRNLLIKQLRRECQSFAKQRVKDYNEIEQLRKENNKLQQEVELHMQEHAEHHRDDGDE